MADGEKIEKRATTRKAATTKKASAPPTPAKDAASVAKAKKAAAKATARPAVKAVKPVKRKPSDPPLPFTGFPKDYLAFFRELSKNNDREWFEANRHRFEESVKEPLRSFIAAMDLPLGRFADCFVADTRPQGGSMFRIYRDTRFSRDKSPYKDNGACQFRHMAGKDAHAPGFYVHLSPKEVFYGGGIWVPPAPELRKVRDAIVADPERWREITRAPAFRRRFGEVAGDGLKRPPVGYDPEHEFVEDLKKQSFFAMEEVEPKAILSKDFAKQVARSFEALGPFMEFLTDALGLPYHLDH